MPSPTQRDFSFRRATIADVERLRVHVQHAYRGDESRKGWTTEADLLDGQRTDPRELQALIAAADAQLWLLERDEELLGSMVVKRESDEVAHVGMIAVHPEQQAQGIGRALLDKAEQVTREQGCSRLEMTVIGQRQELIAWYERRGFKQTEEQRPFPYGDQRFGLPRLRDLYFVVLVKDVSARQ
jgi:ribosomal protein S18 acetylase RimI-like enzyme